MPLAALVCFYVSLIVFFVIVVCCYCVLGGRLGLLSEEGAVLNLEDWFRMYKLQFLNCWHGMFPWGKKVFEVVFVISFFVCLFNCVLFLLV